MAKTTAKSLVLSAEEEALVVAFRNLIGASATETDAVEDDDVEEVDEDDEDDDEDDEVETPDREEVESLGIKDLRTLAKKYGIEDTKKADSLAAFEEFYDEDDDEDDDDDDEEEVEEVEEVEDDDDDEDEEGEWDRESLEELDLKDLRKVAKEEGHTVPRGADQDALIDLILGEDSEDEEEDDDEDEDGDEEVEELDEDALNAMSHKELIGLAKELDVKVPTALKKSTKANQKKLVALILDEGEDED
jgi:hypothetical protein